MQQSTMQMVTEFHQTFDPQAIRDTPGMCDRKYFDFRINFMLEEKEETVKAVKENDIVEIADGLGDLRYVLYGMALNFGYQHIPEADALFNFNMSVDYYLGAMVYELEYMHQCYQKGDYDRIARGIANCDRLIGEAEVVAGISKVMPAVIAEIHRSNMTKCCDLEDMASLSVDHLKACGIDCYYVESNGKWVVRRKSDDKIQKPINFQPPALGTVLRTFMPIIDTDPR